MINGASYTEFCSRTVLFRKHMIQNSGCSSKKCKGEEKKGDHWDRQFLKNKKEEGQKESAPSHVVADLIS